MRIVSLAPSNTEILFALGLGSDIVGATRFCDYPDAARRVRRMGGWLDADFTEIDRANPDIVLTSTFLQDGIHQKLKDRYEVMHVDPETLEDVFNSVLDIGRRFGRGEKAAELVGSMKEKINATEDLTKDEPAVRMYVEEWNKPPTVSGNWVPALVEKSGGVSMADEGRRSRAVETEEVLKFDPDVIVLTWCGFDKRVDTSAVGQRDFWNALRAVRHGRIHVFEDSLLNRPGPRLARGCEALARAAHPDVFKE